MGIVFIAKAVEKILDVNHILKTKILFYQNSLKKEERHKIG